LDPSGEQPRRFFNQWSEKAGLLLSQAGFEDVYGLDPELLSMVPQPAQAVVLLFPLSEQLTKTRRDEDVKLAESGQPKIDPTLLWIKQTIGNACGTMALIHALANSGVPFAPLSPLSQFIDECKHKTPEQRAKLLETTPLFANIHSQTAASGQTAVPTNLDTDLHFTCFVAAPEAEFRERAKKAGDLETGNEQDAEEEEESSGMRLIELDGRREGPIDRGECKDFLKDVADVVKRIYLAQSSSMHFSMMALATPPAPDSDTLGEV